MRSVECPTCLSMLHLTCVSSQHHTLFSPIACVCIGLTVWALCASTLVFLVSHLTLFCVPWLQVLEHADQELQEYRSQKQPRPVDMQLRSSSRVKLLEGAIMGTQSGFTSTEDNVIPSSLLKAPNLLLFIQVNSICGVLQLHKIPF